MDQYFPYTFDNIVPSGSDDKALSIPGARIKSVHHRPFVGSIKIVDVTKQRTYLEGDGSAIPADGWVLETTATSQLTLTVENHDAVALTRLKVSVRTDAK